MEYEENGFDCAIHKLILQDYKKTIKAIRKYKDETSENKKALQLSEVYLHLRGLEERFYNIDKQKCQRILEVLFGKFQRNVHPLYEDMSSCVHVNRKDIGEANIRYIIRPTVKSLLKMSSYCCWISLKKLGMGKKTKKMIHILKSNGFKHKKYGSNKAMKKLQDKLC